MTSVLRLLTLPDPHLPSRQKIPRHYCQPALPLQFKPQWQSQPMAQKRTTPPPAAIHAVTTSFELEKRIMSAFLRKVRRAPKIHRPEPPNFEIGWKRTKKINMEKPNGWMIMDFSEKRRGIDGTAALRFGGAAGEGGGDRGRAAREEEEVQLAGGEVEERLATELYRVQLELMEMDLDMVNAASNAWTRPKPAAASPF